MSYWKTVGTAIAICFALAMLWQAALLWSTIRTVASQRVTYFVAAHGAISFAFSLFLAGWITGSLWYLLFRKR